MSVKCILPYTPLLYSKTEVYRGIHFFLIFAHIDCGYSLEPPRRSCGAGALMLRTPR